MAGLDALIGLAGGTFAGGLAGGTRLLRLGGTPGVGCGWRAGWGNWAPQAGGTAGRGPGEPAGSDNSAGSFCVRSFLGSAN